MRTNNYASVLNDKRGLARDQLNLPIARVPIDIHSSLPMRPTHYGPRPIPNTKSMPPSTPAAIASSTTPSRAFSVNKHKVAHNTATTHTVSSTAMDTNSTQDKAGLRISLPRQPTALPKLHVQVPVPDISARFILPLNNNNNNSNNNNSHSYNNNNNIHASNDHHHDFGYYYIHNNDYQNPRSKGGQIYSPYSASSKAASAANRCASWSPSQAIPEGHYSKGFTLTSFHKVADNKHPPSIYSTASSCSSSSSTSSHHAAAATTTVSLKRSNTSHPSTLPRREPTTLSPFQRLVGRSKSLKVKTPASLITVHNSNMETENPILPSEGFASFHNATTINTTTHANSNSNNNNANTISNRPKSVSPRLSKIIHAYEVRPPPTAAGERNSPGDASKHSNTIQSQGSNSSRNNNAPFVSRSPTTATTTITTTTGGVNVLLESQRGVTAASSATATILPSTPTTTTFPSIANTLLPVTYTTIIPSSKKTISKPNSLNSNSRNNSSQDVKAVPVSDPRPIKAGLSVSVPMPVNNNSQVPAIAAMCVGPCKPLWQHTRTNAEQIRALGLTNQEIQKQEKIFELIYTESEYLDDLKNMHKLFVEELNVKMAEARRKKRSSPDKADVKLYERLARLLSHIKDLWNGHQSLLRSLQNKQESESPVVEDIGSVFESFYMFTIYDSYFAQYTTSSRDFQLISSGNSELCLIIRNLLKTPVCKSLSMEGIFLKPIQRLQKYPLFFKDLMNMTPKDDPDYAQLEHALGNHQRGLTKIDDRIWVEEHNEMLKDLQQRIKGLPSNFSLVEKHRYLILDGPVYRVATRQPSKFSFGKHSSFKSEGHGSPISSSMEWRDRFKTPGMNLDTAGDDAAPILIHRPSQLDYHHQHAKPAFSPTPPSSLASSASSSQSGLGSPTVLSSPFPSGKSFTPRAKSYIDPQHHDSGFNKSTFLYQSPSSPPSATTLHSLSSDPSPIPIPNSPPKQQHQPPSVSQLVSHYNFNLSSSFSNFASIGGAGHPRNTSSSALHLPGMIKNSTDVEAEYHVFVFTDIVLWTKRVMSRYHRKEGVPWNFKLVEPVSRLTSVCNTSEDNVFMCTSVNTSSTSYMVRTEDETAARMWRTTVPTLVPFHCSRNLRDRSKK